VEGCELARSNPYHRCSARCEELAAERRALYGGEERPATAGAGGDAAPTLLPGAVPVPSLADGEAWPPPGGGGGRVLPAISSEMGVKWAWGVPGAAWKPAEIIEAAGEDVVVCSLALPVARSKAPSVRVKLEEYLKYFEDKARGGPGGAESPIAEHEIVTEQGRRVGFCLLDWSPFGRMPQLLERWERPSCVLDKTLEESEGDRIRSRSRYFLSFLPASGVMSLRREPRGLAQWFAQVCGHGQYVMYPPAAAADIYGGETTDYMSYFNPFEADYEQFPRARRVRQDARAGVLHPGQILLVPAGWWVATRSLSRSVVFRRAFPTSESHARLIQGSGGGKSTCHSSDGALGDSVETCDDPDADIFKRSAGYRARGNTEFKRGRYREACEAYTRAISLLRGEDDFCFDERHSEGRGDLGILYSNRGACQLKLGRYVDAVEDCNEVLRSGRCDAVAVKALFRRGKAHEGLGDVKPAYRDFRQVVELEPNNVAALMELENYRSVLHRLIVKQRGTPENREKKENLMSLA